MSDQAPEFLTVKEVADRFRVNPVTVYRLVEDGRLPVVRFGRKGIRIPQSAVERFISESLTQPQAAESVA